MKIIDGLIDKVQKRAVRDLERRAIRAIVDLHKFDDTLDWTEINIVRKDDRRSIRMKCSNVDNRA